MRFRPLLLATFASLSIHAAPPATQPDPAVTQSKAFQVTAEELDKLMKADSAANSKEPLSFPKGNGLRILMTGHSWVAPARISLPKIAEAAGLTGHHQRSHTSGGMTGSALSIWLSEVGKFRGQPAKPILLPAIATGQWDVMTWGAFYGDTPDIYCQWIDLCQKYNPTMTFAIQDGWPTYRTPLGTPEETLKTLDESQASLQTVFKQMYAALDAKYPGKVHIIPAGDAVVRTLHLYYTKQLPTFDCVSEHLGGKTGIYKDGGHLSLTSGTGYLVGYAYYGTLYKKSPELLENFNPPGVNKDVDRLLRKCAWEAVINSPLSGVTDKNHNGIGDEIEAKP